MYYLEKELQDIEKIDAYNIRKEIFTEQLWERGFHDGHTFDLYNHLAELILARLQRYKELAENAIIINFPLDDMISAFKLVLEKNNGSWDDKDKEVYKKGMKAFGDYFMALWW